MIIPQNRLQLHLLYFFVSNINVEIPYERFEEITPTYRRRASLCTEVSHLRLYLGPLGFFAVNIHNYGYKCIRIRKKKEFTGEKK
jgi:hypothetical protein